MHRLAQGALLSLAFCGTPSAADDTATLEFQQRARALGESISTDTTRESEHCAQLRREVEAQRGLPQRSYTARQAYRAECMRDETSPMFNPPGIGN